MIKCKTCGYLRFGDDMLCCTYGREKIVMQLSSFYLLEGRTFYEVVGAVGDLKCLLKNKFKEKLQKERMEK